MNNEVQTTKLSLFQIEAELRGLAEQRCDALDRIANLHAAVSLTGSTADLVEAIEATLAEIETCDKLIRAYVSKEVQKVDSCANLILDLKARVSIHRQEADRLYMLAKSEESTRDRVEELILAVMDEFQEKRLYGRAYDLVAVGNGGVQPLKIAQPEMVPLPYRRHMVRLTHEQANELYKMAYARPDIQRALVDSEKTCEPDNSAIREAMQRHEGVPGCWLEPRGKNLQIK